MLLPIAPLDGAGDLRSPAKEGVFKDNAGRWPRRFGGGF
jgi:hypothetical protein